MLGFKWTLLACAVGLLDHDEGFELARWAYHRDGLVGAAHIGAPNSRTVIGKLTLIFSAADIPVSDYAKNEEVHERAASTRDIGLSRKLLVVKPRCVGAVPPHSGPWQRLNVIRWLDELALIANWNRPRVESDLKKGRGRLPAVLATDDCTRADMIPIESSCADVDIGAELVLPYLASHGDGIVRGFGSSLGFRESVLRVFQREGNKDNTNASEHRGKRRSNEHPEGPLRHVALGLQIAYVSLAFLIGFGISLCGFYRAGDALYGLLDSGKGWSKVLGWVGLGYLGEGLSDSVIIYCVSAAK